MKDLNFRKGDAKTEVFGSNRMLPVSYTHLDVYKRQEYTQC